MFLIIFFVRILFLLFFPFKVFLLRLIVSILVGILFAFFEIKKVKKWIISLFFTILNFGLFLCAISVMSGYLWFISTPFINLFSEEIYFEKFFHQKLSLVNLLLIFIGTLCWYSLLAIISSRFKIEKFTLKETIKSKWLIILLYFLSLSASNFSLIYEL